MATFLMVLFVILCLFLALLILIQQGKGDMGLGSMGGGSQLLFGGSGGQSFFEKITWIMGALFIFGALGISIMRSQEHGMSRLKGVTVQKTVPAQKNIPKEQKQSPQENKTKQSQK